MAYVDNYVDKLRADFIQRYGQIEEYARETILSGRVVPNPLLTASARDNRYTLVATSFYSGEVDEVLKLATNQLREDVNLFARYTPDGFRHSALREIHYKPGDRKSNGIGENETPLPPLTALMAREYYRSISCAFRTESEPIEVELFKVIPTIDREQPSLTVVGAFLPVNKRIIDVRQRINDGVVSAGLPLSGRLGEIRVIFSTLARFAQGFINLESALDFLKVLDNINTKIQGQHTSLDQFEILSTHLSYLWTEDAVFMDPPISLTQPNTESEPRFIKSSLRRVLGKP